MRELEREIPADAGLVSRVAALPRLAVVGKGRVGRSIAAAARAAGLDAVLAGREDAGRACAGAEMALLCVPDSEIPAAAALAGAAPGLRFAGHTSGACGLDAVAPATASGAAAFALHPLQTVPAAETDLRGAPCAVAGSDPEALEVATRLAGALGMQPFEIADSDRAAYHAAAAIASNFLVALEESAAELLERLGVESPHELLAPLVLRTAANWSEHGADALTGPIARGDEATVERHLTALAKRAPELLPLYEALAERTREIAGRHGEPG